MKKSEMEAALGGLVEYSCPLCGVGKTDVYQIMLYDKRGNSWSLLGDAPRHVEEISRVVVRKLRHAKHPLYVITPDQVRERYGLST